MPASKLRIIVSGMVAQYPVGGVAWDYLQYLIGLSQLGHDVYYHEDTWSWPYDPIQNTTSANGEYSAKFIGNYLQRYAPDLVDHWHYDHLHERSFGMERSAFDEIARSADLFINVSGASAIPTELGPNCVKVFLDSDPGYNQIMLSERFDWSENVDRWCDQVAAHDRHFTYAENLGNPDCLVPDVGFQWMPTRMPIALNLWNPCPPAPANSAWTTVMTWNNFKGPLIYKNVEYKGKGAEFQRIIDLPSRIDAPLRIAVGGKGVPRTELESSGWEVVDGPTTTLTPQLYQNFISDSRGEISTAKNVYAAMRTGWFSCRSACYLAAGRPTVVQDTGFSRFIPCGKGLLAFNTQDEAADLIEQVESDYETHSLSAIEIAREHFQAETVLGKLIEDAMN